MAIYELWETRSGNLMATFDTEAAALATVREAISRHGDGYAATLALGREDSRGRSKMIAMGTELAARAQAEERAEIAGGTVVGVVERGRAGPAEASVGESGPTERATA